MPARITGWTTNTVSSDTRTKKDCPYMYNVYEADIRLLLGENLSEERVSLNN